MLTVWHFRSAMGAAAGQIRLRDLHEHGELRVLDAVTVIWVRGAERPHVGHLMRRSVAAVSTDSVLGALAGSLFLAPVADPMNGPRLAAVFHRLNEIGIQGSFLREIQSRLVPGTSTLLVLSGDADLDTIRELVERGVGPSDVTLMAAWLPNVAPHALTALVDHGAPRRVARSG